MALRFARAIAFACALGMLAACGGGGSSDSQDAPPPPPPPTAYADIPRTDAEAARFLTQATFGPTRAEIAHLRQIGYRKWLDEQLNDATTPPTLMLPYLEQLAANKVDRINQSDRRKYWLWQAAVAKDQLRMRMGFALSEIFVVSELEIRSNTRVADYQDTLARGAFGSYRDLLGKVTLHPAMGYYLSYVYNQKANPSKGISPDENYGREVMQLFSIGLVKRNADFSQVLDGQGQPVPTYDQDVVGAMARVFTGWTYAGRTDKNYGAGYQINAVEDHAPMECHPAFHDAAPKTIFDGIVVDKGNDCVASLKVTLDALANHPNTAPFISRQLIQRFVTSNPSPAYVGRVVGAWKASGGNLGQVIRTILLDDEARVSPTDPAFGKAREPLVKIATIWRAFDAKYVPESTGRIPFGFSYSSNLSVPLGQDTLRAPSVFNFFTPDFSLPAAGDTQGIFGPEFQILTEATYQSAANQHYAVVWPYTGAPPTKTTPAPYLDISRLTAMADVDDHAGMIEEINLLLFNGTLSSASKATMVGMLDKLKAAKNSSSDRARSLILLALDSPEFAIQR